MGRTSRTSPCYAAQGNILVGAETVAALAETFQATADRPLARRLLECSSRRRRKPREATARGQQSASLLIVERDGGYASLRRTSSSTSALEDPRTPPSTSCAASTASTGACSRRRRARSGWRSKASSAPKSTPASRATRTTTSLDEWAGVENTEERGRRRREDRPNRPRAAAGGDRERGSARSTTIEGTARPRHAHVAATSVRRYTLGIPPAVPGSTRTPPARPVTMSSRSTPSRRMRRRHIVVRGHCGDSRSTTRPEIARAGPRQAAKRDPRRRRAVRCDDAAVTGRGTRARTREGGDRRGGRGEGGGGRRAPKQKAGDTRGREGRRGTREPDPGGDLGDRGWRAAVDGTTRAGVTSRAWSAARHRGRSTSSADRLRPGARNSAGDEIEDHRGAPGLRSTCPPGRVTGRALASRQGSTTCEPAACRADRHLDRRESRGAEEARERRPGRSPRVGRS